MFVSCVPDDIVIQKIHKVHRDEHTKPYFHIKKRYSSGIVYVLSGRSLYTLKNDRFTAAADDIFYLAEGENYQIDVDPAMTFSYIYVNFTLAEESRAAFRSGICMSGCREQCLELFQRMENIFCTKESMYLFSCRNTLCSILSILISSDRRKYMPGEKVKPLQSAVELMNTSYGDSMLSIGKIASASGLSEGYFRRLFREFYRISPSQYLRDLRLSHSRDLLAESAMPISEIAAVCGFSSSYYFSSAFRTASGISPSVWRELHRDNSK